VVEEVLNEAAATTWEAWVPTRREPNLNIPLLAGALVSLDLSSVSGWTKRLIRSAYQTGTAQMATLKVAESAALDVASLFKASLRQDSEHIKAIAARLGVDPDAFRAVADLVPVPFLHACARQWAASSYKGWMQGYCPGCGAWPALAEVRGIERSRHLRCSRCGGDWETRWLSCPYCLMADHEQLVSLVPETNGPTTRTIEACKRCLGYVKSFTTLQGSPPGKVMVDDLSSVDLDLAALEQGYKRPVGLGYAIEVTVVDQPSAKRGIFPWSA
jgi:FdhE protein